ncbi:MAG: NADH-quinone oxidoreductase subunit A [Chloroflexi bacterium]|nr:NADH-quinone oxidoreductase subunit A [Chloroflexota bacterium]
MLDDYFRQYGLVLIFSIVALVVPAGMLLLSWAAQYIGARPSKPSMVKSQIYECGMETIGGRWARFNIRYYLFAILFLVFDVEAVFLYPWAIHFRQLGLFALVEMAVFIAILTLGWVYAWRKRALDWR